ncbi:hypothetical protein [uncultured Croceicoccus sp.]|uniref:hypothetical protein n=1 Tax=uncultured Croceicoccus sp. TaxID=1295329 RepID=UPI00262E72CD|nr:hypothetical protein [uncultured Croceicoccus sp.]
MAERSVFYRKKGETAWKRATGPATGFAIKRLPAEIKYEVDIGDGVIKEVTTRLPNIGEKWTPDVFPRHLFCAFYAEDLPDGKVAEWVPRGLVGNDYDTLLSPRIGYQTNEALQPTKTADGVVFAENSGQFLFQSEETSSAPVMRWFMPVFKLNKAPVDDGHIFSINYTHKMPRVSVVNGKVRSQWDGQERDFDQTTGLPLAGSAGNRRDNSFISDCDGPVFDDTRWNISLSHRRNGKTFSRLNGVPHSTHSAPDKRWNCVRKLGIRTIIGPFQSTTNSKVTLKYLFMGQGELSEKFERKLEAWVAWDVGQQASLPTNHPYRTTHPVVEADDFDEMFRLAKTDWDAWRTETATFLADDTKKYANRGGPSLPLTDYTRVFLDDFRICTVADSSVYRTDERGQWFGPGWNPAIGGDAGGQNPQMITFSSENPFTPEMIRWNGPRKKLQLLQRWYPDVAPDAVPPPEADIPIQDPQPDVSKGKILSTAIFTTDNSGFGRSFKGGYVVRARTKMDHWSDPKADLPALFWALWGYGTRTLEWGHEHRIEFDYWETEGWNAAYLNGAVNHVHETNWSFVEDRFSSNKGHAGSLTDSNGWPANTQYRGWDGKWVTWEIRVDPDFIYINICLDSPESVTDRSGMVELFRFPTSPMHLQPFNVIANTCSRVTQAKEYGGHFRRVSQKVDWDGNKLWLDGNGAETTTNTGTPAKEWAIIRYWLDWVEVLQRNEIVYPATAPAPFTARPTLTKATRTFTCDAKLPSVSHIEYLWHIDGYPVGGKHGASYTVPDGMTGNVKCLVQAAGAMNQPEAWTDPVSL